MKLKYRDIKTLREKLLAEQHNLCAVCGEPLDANEAVLDHDHKTGKIRSVLHRGCNAMLGKIENNMPRNRMNLERLERFCLNITKYIRQEREDLIHPTHNRSRKKK